MVTLLAEGCDFPMIELVPSKLTVGTAPKAYNGTRYRLRLVHARRRALSEEVVKDVMMMELGRYRTWLQDIYIQDLE